MTRRSVVVAAVLLVLAVLVGCASAEAGQPATPTERIHAVNGDPRDPSAPSYDVVTFCNHGNRVYLTNTGAAGYGVAMAVLPGPTRGC